MHDQREATVVHVPGLATVTIDPEENGRPTVEIVLDPEHRSDLNDVEQQNGLPPGVLFDGDSAASVNSSDLTQFMEVLYHWGRPGEWNWLADQIEEALWQKRDATQEFNRPDANALIRFLMRRLPPKPDRHIILSFEDLRPRDEPWHYAVALGLLGMLGGLMYVQINLWPFMANTPVSLALELALNLRTVWWWWVIALVVMPGPIYLLYRRIRLRRSRLVVEESAVAHSRFTYGFFNRMVVIEEQTFREGAEGWTWRQRAMSCLIFGVIQQANLFYPFATILPIAISGGVYMAIYLRACRRTSVRRRAVLEAAVQHRIYNRVVLAIVGFVLAIVAVQALLIGGLTILAIFVGRFVLMLMKTARSVLYKPFHFGKELWQKRRR